jgi:hypothetical protein
VLSEDPFKEIKPEATESVFRGDHHSLNLSLLSEFKKFKKAFPSEVES